MRHVLKLLVALFFVAGAAHAQGAQERVITTTGQGSVATPPDMASISLGVTHQDEEAARAMMATSEGVTAILSRLSEAGIASRDMQTENIALRPLWSNRGSNADSPAQITGFVASNTLTVRVNDLAALGGILDLVVQDGANTFNGLSFGLQDPKPLADAARAQAVSDAIDRAGQLAAAAGVTLGPVQSISEQGGMARPQMMEMASARQMDMPIAAGELTVQAQVNMVFSIAN
ncbi:26 kDa periplasmic immunogenic protein [Roseobacter fucihabitans]|uniref:26 kDa periplasmic immunogenic protein n=1 Tax=Roseobacter fucihabitans TaxID=1537242 RepID=A0ABZ2BT97_9RHOB|nr:SIMPL domain-containing protein [Roseobacter litoralis]MBC6965445.1 26 kDa periplasmic immunogenic protein precursor [Roseobacter litoralis]